MKYLVILLLMLSILVIAITLGSENQQIVTFNYLLAKSQFKLSTLLVCFLGGGFLVGWLLSGLSYLKSIFKNKILGTKYRRLQRQLDDIEVAKTNTYIHPDEAPKGRLEESLEK